MSVRQASISETATTLFKSDRISNIGCNGLCFCHCLETENFQFTINCCNYFLLNSHNLIDLSQTTFKRVVISGLSLCICGLINVASNRLDYTLM
jgi:hypothetical protein